MFQNITPITRNIIILNVVFFVLAHFIYPSLMPMLAAYFPMSPNFVSWQIITHMFMHGSIMHLAFNMLSLLSFGPVLERIFDQKNFIILYLVSGLGSFILYNAWNYYQVMELTKELTAQGVNVAEIYAKASYYNTTGVTIDLPAKANREAVQSLFTYLRVPMVGASGAIFGIMAAFATLFPNAELMLMFIPFPIKAKILFPILIIGSLYLGIKQMSGDNIAHFAHVGGALIGWLWVRNWKKNRDRIA